MTAITKGTAMPTLDGAKDFSPATTRPLTVDAPPTIGEAWGALTKLFGPNMLTATIVVLTKEPDTTSVRMTTYTFPDGALEDACHSTTPGTE